MKSDKTQIILSYVLTIIFIVACVIGGAIAGDKLSNLKKDNNEEKVQTKYVSKVEDEFVEGKHLTEVNYYDSFECENLDCKGEFVYSNDSKKIQYNGKVLEGSSSFIFTNGDKEQYINNIESVTSYVDDEGNYYFMFDIYYMLLKDYEFEFALYDEDLNLIHEFKHVVDYRIVELEKDDKVTTCFYYSTFDEGKLDYHKYIVGEKDYVFYSIDGANIKEYIEE